MKENIVYKGSERRVIVVKSASSKHFEEAHFFLKAGEEEAVPPMPELLREANRIVEQSLIPPRKRQIKEKRGWFFRGFLTGLTTTAGVTAALWLLQIWVGPF